MKSPMKAGRAVGILLLAHLATGLITPYVMLRPLNEPLAYDANDSRPCFSSQTLSNAFVYRRRGHDCDRCDRVANHP
jgi:hypothetical protein